MAVLTGTHAYQLDQKGRISLPAKLRAALTGGGFLTVGQEDCLYLFPREQWERAAALVPDVPAADGTERAWARMFFPFADEVDLDSQGRMVVPQRLRGQAAIEREVVVLGVGDHIELWNPDVWDRYQQQHQGPYREGQIVPRAGRRAE